MSLRKDGCSHWHGEIILDSDDNLVELNLVEILDFGHFYYVEYIEWMKEEALKWEMTEMESGIG